MWLLGLWACILVVFNLCCGLGFAQCRALGAVVAGLRRPQGRSGFVGARNEQHMWLTAPPRSLVTPSLCTVDGRLQGRTH